MCRRSISVAVAVLLCSVPAVAQTGSLDTTFGSGGKYISDLGGAPEYGPAVAVQTDSRIIVAGKNNNGRDDDIATLRLTRTGALDTSFNGTGSVVLSLPPRDDNAKSVLVLPDGRILVGGEAAVAGYGQHAILRYLADGRADTSWGRVGGVTIDFGRPSHIHGMALQPDGKVVVVGEAYAGTTENAFAIARLETTGALDTTFGSGGRVERSYGTQSNGHSVAIASDGKIIVGGYVVGATTGQSSGFLVTRFKSDGTVDTSFGTNGVTIASSGSGYTNICHKVLLQADGKIVLVGSQVRNNVGDFMLVRVTSSGALDTTFGTGGVVTTEFGGRSPSSSEEASAGVLQPDGKIIAGGYSEGKFALARYLSTGALDTSFGTGGLVTFSVGSGGDDQIKSLALAPDGKIVATGYSRVTSTSYKMAVARLQNDSGGAQSDSDRLFNWAEANYPQYFSPPGPVTGTISGYQARVYANGNAIATKGGHLFAYGTVFGGLLDVGLYAPYLAQAVRDGY